MFVLERVLPFFLLIAAGALRRTLLNPIVIGAVLGAVLMLTRRVLPVVLDQLFGMAAASGSPVALVALGAVMALEAGRPEREIVVPVAVSSALKVFAVPGLVWIATGLAGAPPPFRTVATLMAGCPTAVNVFIQAGAYGVFVRGAAQVVVVSTLIAAASLTGLAALLAR